METEEEGKDSGDKGADSTGGDPDEGVQGFAAKWAFIIWIDTVSETQRISWDEALRKNIIEFLNVLSYAKDKGEDMRRQMHPGNIKTY